MCVVPIPDERTKSTGSESLIYIRPDLDGIRPLRAPRTALMKAVWRGEAAVTAEVLDRIQSWVRVPVTS